MALSSVSFPLSGCSLVFSFKNSDAVYRACGSSFSSIDEIFSFAHSLAADMLSVFDGDRTQLYFFSK